MKIENVCINNYDKTNSKTIAPSFKAIHPTKYYIKAQDGQYKRVSNKDTIQYLQKKIISWLNKTANDNKRIIEGNPRKVNPKETQDEAKMRKFLEYFFMSNDKDYQSKRVAKSIYVDKDDAFVPYIITGKTIDMAGQGKPIGKARKQVNESRQYAQTYYGVDAKSAEQYVSSVAKRNLAQAKDNYHRENEALVQKLMGDNITDKATVNFYFDPEFDSKGNLTKKFKLKNASWLKFMI